MNRIPYNEFRDTDKGKDFKEKYNKLLREFTHSEACVPVPPAQSSSPVLLPHKRPASEFLDDYTGKYNNLLGEFTYSEPSDVLPPAQSSSPVLLPHKRPTSEFLDDREVALGDE